MQFSGDQLDPNSRLNPKLFSYKGRIGRLRFFVINLITYILFFVTQTLAHAPSAVVNPSPEFSVILGILALATLTSLLTRLSGYENSIKPASSKGLKLFKNLC